MGRLSRLTPEQRSQAARAAALARWSREDPRPTVMRANAALMKRFLDEVDPHRTLPEDERVRRAECAKKAYFTRLSLASSKARSARRAANSTGTAA